MSLITLEGRAAMRKRWSGSCWDEADPQLFVAAASDVDALLDALDAMQRDYQIARTVAAERDPEKRFRRWMREVIGSQAPESCVNINRVQDYLRDHCENSLEKLDAVDDLESIRVVNENLRVAVQGLARAMFEEAP